MQLKPTLCWFSRTADLANLKAEAAQEKALLGPSPMICTHTVHYLSLSLVLSCGTLSGGAHSVPLTIAACSWLRASPDSARAALKLELASLAEDEWMYLVRPPSGLHNNQWQSNEGLVFLSRIASYKNRATMHG